MNNMYDILARLNSVEKHTLNESVQVAEKIEPPIKTDPAERGKYKGKDIGDLKAMKKANLEKTEKYRERGEKVPDDLKSKTAELNFAIRAKQAGGGKWGKIKEEEMEEGNEFTQARLAAIRAGKPTFSIDGKTYKVTGDTSDEKAQMDESVIEEGYADFFDKKQMYRKIGADVEGRSDDYVVTFKDGSRKRYQEVDGRRRVTTLEPIDRNDAVDDQGEVVKRGRGRPKGTGRKMGARGKTMAETELEEDYDKDEYDEEGEMAKSQARTIEDAAKELQEILDDDENLPEWVQKKIVLAKEYIDSARDYMKANPDEEEVEVEMDDEELVAEKAVSKAQRAAAGIARAAQKGDIPKSELRGASKEMAKMPAGELEKFAKTKEKGLPEKVKEEDKEEVDETTVSGSVATAPASAKSKGIFGKGVYESQIAESFENKLDSILNESVSINMSMGDNGEKSLSVNATDDDAVKLAQLLKLAGMESNGYHDACPACGGIHEGDCRVMEEDLANSPDPQYAELGDTRDYGVAGGLNGPKLQSNPNNMGDNPLAMGRLGTKASPNLNLGAVAEDVEKQLENRLNDLYKRIQ